ncbi:DNA-binding GntR family transcriptional regulator [Rhodoligotrophos appendicifer]|uniref:GntR family transcriptional regulator n=1 Tax=Rhodoligotrophos appendicifer TaxID=987056 RepID=UPI00118504A5|nr:GntR family transcriptional regulator [Rhodoligotrophos appendicifer]
MTSSGARLLSTTDLQSELSSHIREWIRSTQPAIGTVIRESVLARDLGVSRSPVRAALAELVVDGLVAARPHGGYQIIAAGPAAPATETAGGSASRPYALMLRDIILNTLPTPATESALMRRYDLGRGEVRRTLRRLTREGLAEPLPGRGWSIIELTQEQVAMSYQLRLLLEPALLLDDSFGLSLRQLDSLKHDHLRQRDALSSDMAWEELFALDALFHESLAKGSKNSLVLDIISRQNRLRRLCEYISYVRLERIRGSIGEHVAILEALIADNRKLASRLMREHIAVSRDETISHFAADLETFRVRNGPL